MPGRRVDAEIRRRILDQAPFTHGLHVRCREAGPEDHAMRVYASLSGHARSLFPVAILAAIALVETAGRRWC